MDRRQLMVRARNSSSRRRIHEPHDPSGQLRLAQSAVGPHEVVNLRHDLVHLRVLSRQPQEGLAVLEPLVQIGRALTSRLRIDEVDCRGRPGRFECPLDFGQVFRSQSVERVDAAEARAEKSAEARRAMSSSVA